MYKNKAPAFQFYPADYVSDAKLLQLSSAQEGIYWRLVAHSWLENGLSGDSKKIALLCKRDVSVDDVDHVLSEMFFKRDGKYFQKRVEKERKRQVENRKKRSESGKLGAQKRWKKTDSKCHPFAIDVPMAKHSSSTSTSTSSANVSSKEDTKPIFQSCLNLRMSSEEYERVRKWYEKKNLTVCLPFAIEELDAWLGGETKVAKTARRQPTHHKRLFATWVIENARKRQAAMNPKSRSGKKTAEEEIAELMGDCSYGDNLILGGIE